MTRTVDAGERRARLARRQRLAPGCRASSVEEAARSIVCFHATDPVTVYLSALARVDGFALEDMTRALYEQRSIVKHMAMRRTIFAFGRDALPCAQGAASARVAAAERRRLVADVEKAGLHADGAAWLDAACAAVLDALAGGREATSVQLRSEIGLLEGVMTYGEGKSWGGAVPVAPRVLTVLSASGLVMRAGNDGAWTSSRPRFARTEDWLGAPLAPLEPGAANAELVRRWLLAFGPGTEADIKWWMGSTLGAVRGALADLGAVQVDLGDGTTGWLAPGDEEPVEPVEPWAALLPSLDPAAMGWSERDWYLGAHRDAIFDRMGNAGTTAWWDGRIVGGWRSGADGDVELQLLEDVGAEGAAALEAEAARLGEWLAGVRVSPRYPSPLSKR